MLVGCTAAEMYDSVFYCLISTDATFDEAQLDCANRPENASLVTIDNADINNFITYFAGGRGRAWIGATDQETEGVWKWPNGNTLDFTNWRTGQPNNYGGSQNCAALNYRDAGKWDDVDCETRRPYICKRRSKGRCQKRFH